MTAQSLTLMCGEVAELLGYRRRDGKPNRDAIRRLAREGKIPPPIDDTLTTGWWRWSRAEVESYAAGEWKPRRNGMVS